MFNSSPMYRRLLEVFDDREENVGKRSKNLIENGDCFSIKLVKQRLLPIGNDSSKDFLDHLKNYTENNDNAKVFKDSCTPSLIPPLPRLYIHEIIDMFRQAVLPYLFIEVAKSTGEIQVHYNHDEIYPESECLKLYGNVEPGLKELITLYRNLHDWLVQEILKIQN